MIYYYAHENENQSISMEEFKKIEDVVLYELKIRKISYITAKGILEKISERLEYQSFNDNQIENSKDILIKRLEERNQKLEDKECNWGNEKRELKYQIKKQRIIFISIIAIFLILLVLSINY